MPYPSGRKNVKLSGMLSQAWQGLRMWEPKRHAVAALAAAGILVFIGLATVLIPNPVFARDIPPVWWNYPVWVLTSLFSGMLLASYLKSPQEPVADPNQSADNAGVPGRRNGRLGAGGAILAWFAVGCPVCNKIALLALGYSGAIAWFAPIQPFLAVLALLLTLVALVGRLRGMVACPVAPTPAGAAA